MITNSLLNYIYYICISSIAALVICYSFFTLLIINNIYNLITVKNNTLEISTFNSNLGVNIKIFFTINLGDKVISNRFSNLIVPLIISLTIGGI
ncbi:hypothetical protein MNBD_IGNAVI01-2079 [hydrothermal vent metagenome]|uniref:Uncharacterized protein n=1 Tax=hydrothermal vent metagenome TaxID=652676 RepID=A0A3B1CLK8_9ZZZZ